MIGNKRNLNCINNDNLSESLSEPALKKTKIDHQTIKNQNTKEIESDFQQTVKENIVLKYHTNFPSNFYKFYKWLQSNINSNDMNNNNNNKSETSMIRNPLHSLKSCIGIEFVGPFQYLNQELQSLTDEQLLIHYRFHFDLPEFQTIAIHVSDSDSNINDNKDESEDIDIHYGYWRDDAEQYPIGIVSNECPLQPSSDLIANHANAYKISPFAGNIFSFIKILLMKELENIQRNASKKKKAKKKRMKQTNIQQNLCNETLESLEAFVKQNNIPMIETQHLLIKNKKKRASVILKTFENRKKNVNSKCFHELGIVCPMNGQWGYRPLMYSVFQLKKILNRMFETKMKIKLESESVDNGSSKSLKKKKKKSKKTKQLRVNSEELDILVSNIYLADDEGDPGLGFELGINLFCSHQMFERQCLRLLKNAYSFMNRSQFIPILEAHLMKRSSREGIVNELNRIPINTIADLNIDKEKKVNKYNSNSEFIE